MIWQIELSITLITIKIQAKKTQAQAKDIKNQSLFLKKAQIQLFSTPRKYKIKFNLIKKTTHLKDFFW
jgi:hypothetical protein